MTWVFQHSEATQGARLVLLALADFAHDDGTKAFPSVQTLATKARLSPRAVQYALRKLQDDGAIECAGKTAVSGTTIYNVIMDGGRKNCVRKNCGAQSATSGVQPTAPNPLEEPLVGCEESAREPALRISGKKVKPEAWEKTEKILDSFNEQAGKKLRLVTSASKPSEAAKRIYGRVVAYPDITLEEHEDIIRRTLASRWWGEGPPGIGVVYGPKVFEDNITREAKASAKAAKADAKDARKERAARGLAAIQRIIDSKENA